MVSKEINMEEMYTDIELIDKYQRGIASENEKLEVHGRLVTDKKFRDLFDDLEVMSEGIRQTGARSTLKEKLAKLEETLEDEDESNSPDQQEVDIGDAREEESKQKVIILWYQNPAFRVAASIVLLLAAWFVFYPMNTVNNQELVAEYFEPYANTTPKTRGEVIESKDVTTEAFTAYDRGDYEKAIPHFERAVKESDDPLLNTFYLGNAYLATGDGQNATKEFATVVEAGKGLAGVAEWYLALSYLQTDNADMAITTLLKIRDQGEDYYAGKANKLLKELE